MIVQTMIAKSENLINQIHNHPFNQELRNGSLPTAKFIFYLQQDALYLADYSRALSLTAARLGETSHLQQFSRFALNAIHAEIDLHHQFLNHWKMDETKSEPSPACFMYVNYLLKTASLASVEEAVASLLPCFFIYNEVGKKMQACPVENNPYQAWIDLYSSEDFETSVQFAVGITTELAEKASSFVQDKMIKAFIRATSLEWSFWQSAYLLEKWPLEC